MRLISEIEQNLVGGGEYDPSVISNGPGGNGWEGSGSMDAMGGISTVEIIGSRADVAAAKDQADTNKTVGTAVGSLVGMGVGRVSGMEGGALLGGAIGSVVPGIGTLAGALIGGTVGMIFGQAAGGAIGGAAGAIIGKNL